MPLELRAVLERYLGRDAAASFPDGVIERLERLDDLVARWDRAVGLVGFRGGEERARRYFAEALAALAFLPAEGDVVDIGSGGGSPALPLAIARPTLSWTLVESNARKCVFLEEAVEALGLESVQVQRARYEEVAFAGVDAVTVRGVAFSKSGLETALAWLGPGGRLLWLTSEARVAEAQRRFAGRSLGAVRLVQRGAWLLVVHPPEHVSRET